MDPAEDQTAFTAAANRSLRDAGLAGEAVDVRWDGRALTLAGSASGSLRIEPAMLARVRFGYFQGKYRRLFTASLWLIGSDRPLALEPAKEGEALAYGRTMRAFAKAVAASRGIGAIEQGISGAGAAMMLVFLMLPPAALTGVALVFVGSGNLPVRGGLLAAAGALLAISLWLYFKRQRPASVASLDAIEVQLPDPVSGS